MSQPGTGDPSRLQGERAHIATEHPGGVLRGTNPGRSYPPHWLLGGGGSALDHRVGASPRDVQCPQAEPHVLTAAAAGVP